MIASIVPLVVGLSGLAGLCIGGLLLMWVRRAPPPLTEEDEERIRDEVAKRAARKAVNEAIARLR